MESDGDAREGCLYYAASSQDDRRARSPLTLNLGLR